MLIKNKIKRLLRIYLMVINTAQLSSLSSMYNDADEKIGTKVQYILVELNV